MSLRRCTIHPALANGLACLLVFLACYGLKYHYSHAGAEDLAWILRPTSGMVHLLSGIRFVRETGAGYINHDRLVIIAPACAGINFLIIAFSLGAFSGLNRLRRRRKGRFRWIAFSGALAYGLTILANAVRIIIAMEVRSCESGSGWLDDGQTHRLVGIAVYLTFLYCYYLLLQKPLSVPSSSSLNHLSLTPLAWYWIIALGIPLVNGAWRSNPSLFIRHCCWTMLGGLAVWSGLFLLHAACQSVRRCGVKAAGRLAD